MSQVPDSLMAQVNIQAAKYHARNRASVLTIEDIQSDIDSLVNKADPCMDGVQEHINALIRNNGEKVSRESRNNEIRALVRPYRDAFTCVGVETHALEMTWSGLLIFTLFLSDKSKYASAFFNFSTVDKTDAQIIECMETMQKIDNYMINGEHCKLTDELMLKAVNSGWIAYTSGSSDGKYLKMIDNPPFTCNLPWSCNRPAGDTEKPSFYHNGIELQLNYNGTTLHGTILQALAESVK
jgi:hypothetical protein